MSGLSNIWEKLSRSKSYRESFVGAFVKRMVPLQIRTLRKERGWSQAELAKEAKLTQGVISRAEDPNYGNLTVNTLVRIAAGFDCAYVGEFVPFSELASRYSNLEHEDSLRVPSFKDDRLPSSVPAVPLASRGFYREGANDNLLASLYAYKNESGCAAYGLIAGAGEGGWVTFEAKPGPTNQTVREMYLRPRGQNIPVPVEEFPVTIHDTSIYGVMENRLPSHRALGA
ncbi:MAG: helix-turn-helix transcriptional regulator [Acidobacteriaceae bacterium]|nr:helix-turn-helix transcriptional regulator [Acidobacteriaceae bacterium]